MNGLIQLFGICLLASLGVSEFQCPNAAYKWYVDPNNCKNYIICLNSNVIARGSCTGELNWWPSIYACNRDLDPTPGATCRPGSVVIPPATVPNTALPVTQGPCSHKAVDGDRSKFYDLEAPEIIKSCAAKLVFDDSLEICTCVLADGESLPACTLMESLLLRLEENLLDSGCNGASVWNAGSQDLNYTSNGKSGSAGKFNSDNKLEYDGWNNKFNGYNAFITLSFDISSGSKSQDEIVMQYGQCTSADKNVIKISLKSNLAVEVMIENNNGSAATIGSNSLSANSYSSVAVTFDGVNVVLYINGNEQAKAALNGGIDNVMCPLEIGKGLNADVDNIRVFNKALSAGEVAALD